MRGNGVGLWFFWLFQLASPVGSTADDAIVLVLFDERTVTEVVLIRAFETNAIGILLDALTVFHAVLELTF